MYVTPWALYDSIAIPTGNNDRDHCNQVRLSLWRTKIKPMLKRAWVSNFL